MSELRYIDAILGPTQPGTTPETVCTDNIKSVAMIFAASRSSGWSAHVLEQLANNRLIRPRGDYVGPRDKRVVPIDQR